MITTNFWWVSVTRITNHLTDHEIFIIAERIPEICAGNQNLLASSRRLSRAITSWFADFYFGFPERRASLSNLQRRVRSFWDPCGEIFLRNVFRSIFNLTTHIKESQFIGASESAEKIHNRENRNFLRVYRDERIKLFGEIGTVRVKSEHSKRRDDRRGGSWAPPHDSFVISPWRDRWHRFFNTFQSAHKRQTIEWIIKSMESNLWLANNMPWTCSTIRFLFSFWIQFQCNASFASRAQRTGWMPFGEARRVESFSFSSLARI